ncbi:MAG: electron transfer flavoprotein subunit beta/FixA family protein [Deltaproteobacteria bacterium]|nr:electron transfer flavoprotein subunit beta/FixA family protein [Deltaproteobacteria bacterium]
MNILVCLKRVPELTEAQIRPTQDGLAIRSQGLVWELNEWDAFALEWALRLAEEAGGSVKAVTLGREDDEEILFRALAMGAGEALRLAWEEPGYLDPALIAQALADLVREIGPDLVLTGVQSSDLGQAQIGLRLAGLLGWAQASMIVGLEEVKPSSLVLRRELEAGWEERLEVDLPAVLTIQSNPNPPRYVSVLGIRKARKRPLEVKPVSLVGRPGLSQLLGLETVVKKRQVEFFDPDLAAQRLAAVIKDRI